jgi:hypothetical protein
VDHGRGQGLVLRPGHSPTGLIVGGCLGLGHSLFLFMGECLMYLLGHGLTLLYRGSCPLLSS